MVTLASRTLPHRPAQVIIVKPAHPSQTLPAL
jgi:hypothetical protein